MVLIVKVYGLLTYVIFGFSTVDESYFYGLQVGRPFFTST